MDVNSVFRAAALLAEGSLLSYGGFIFLRAFHPVKLKPEADQVFAVSGVPVNGNRLEKYIERSQSNSRTPWGNYSATALSLKPETLQVRCDGDAYLVFRNRTKGDVEAEFEIALDEENDQSLFTAAAFGSSHAYIEQMKSILDSALRVAASKAADLDDFSKRGNDLLACALEMSAVSRGLKVLRAEIKSAQLSPASRYDRNDRFDAEGLAVAYPGLSPGVQPG